MQQSDIAEQFARRAGLISDGAALSTQVTVGGDAPVVRIRQSIGGVPVLGGDVVVRLDQNGKVRWHRGGVRDDVRVVTTPRVSLSEATRRSALGGSAAGELAILADGEPRLVWQVVDGPVRALVDARTGDVLQRENVTRAAAKHTARVFDVNPVESELELVTFASLPDDATGLDDGEVEVLNCIDRQACQDYRTIAGVRNRHHCDLEPPAQVDDDGSFEHIGPAEDEAPEDSFAEVQAFYHTKKAQAFFEGLDSDFTMPKLSVVVNMRLPDTTSTVSVCDGERAPLESKLIFEENAYYWPAKDTSVGPLSLTNHRIVLHQTERTDWALDGEVVYHEYTHAVMHTLSDMGYFTKDVLGSNFQAAALHEALSDYFSGAITGNAELGAYAGTDESGPKSISTLLDRRKCSDFMSGEEHDEGIPFASSLWAVRVSLRSKAKRQMFDGAVYRAMAGFGRDEDFMSAFAAIQTELGIATEEFIDAEGLTADQADDLRATVGQFGDKFAQRGLPKCNSRVAEMTPGQTHDYLQLKGPNTFGVESFTLTGVPAPTQFRLHTKEDTTGIMAEADFSFALDDTVKDGSPLQKGPMLGAVLKRGDDVIHWTWSRTKAKHDGDQNARMTVEQGGDGRAAAVFTGQFPKGDYVIQFVSAGEDWALQDVRILVADADGKFDGGRADGGGFGSSSDGGCSAAGETSPPWLALLLVLVAATLRRRSRDLG
jgi:MYXO-CTERM domain-containing protein